MTLLWPQALLLLLVVPLAFLALRALERRRRRAAVTAGLATVSGGGRRRVRGGMPAALTVLGFVALIVALARPQATVALPTEQGIVVLAVDVSGSMAATDLAPTRMAAAKAAATAFVQAQPANVAIGVVAFSDSGISTQAPTKDQASVLAAIDRLAPQKGTSLGQGIQAALKAIEAAETAPSTDYYSNRSPAPSESPAPVPAGSDSTALIVLLSDGENNEQPDPLDAARAAAHRGVRIDTLGIGTTAGSDLEIDGFRVHSALDEPTLQGIAQVTAGTSFSAAQADQLTTLYASLHPTISLQPQPLEVTALVAGAGLALLLVAGAASLAWSGRLP